MTRSHEQDPPVRAARSAGAPQGERYARKALWASIIGYAMDGFDMLILSFMMTPISAELRLSNAQAGSLVTWTLIGALIGGVIFGHLSDRFGRMKVLSWTILLFAVFTGMCALARSYSSLVVFRTICGLGLGGEFGIGMALAAETWPAKQRGGYRRTWRSDGSLACCWQRSSLRCSFPTSAGGACSPWACFPRRFRF